MAVLFHSVLWLQCTYHLSGLTTTKKRIQCAEVTTTQKGIEVYLELPSDSMLLNRRPVLQLADLPSRKKAQLAQQPQGSQCIHFSQHTH